MIKPIGKIASAAVGSIPFIGKPLAAAGEALFGGRSGGNVGESGFGSNLFSGIGSALGHAFGGAAGGLLANKGGQLLGLTPRPPSPKSVSQQIADTNQYLDGVFPGTNPWERLGVNAGNPMEVAQENQRTQKGAQEAALRAQLATQTAQFQFQQKLQETQLRTQENLKRMEIANTKSIAETTARANVLNGVGISDPEALSGVGQFLKTGVVTPELMQIRGTSAMRNREVAVKEQELFNNIERMKIEAKRVSIQERGQFLDEQVRPVLAEASYLSASRSGGPTGLASQAAQKLYDSAASIAGVGRNASPDEIIKAMDLKILKHGMSVLNPFLNVVYSAMQSRKLRGK